MTGAWSPTRYKGWSQGHQHLNYLYRHKCKLAYMLLKSAAAPHSSRSNSGLWAPLPSTVCDALRPHAEYSNTCYLELRSYQGCHKGWRHCHQLQSASSWWCRAARSSPWQGVSAQLVLSPSQLDEDSLRKLAPSSACTILAPDSACQKSCSFWFGSPLLLPAAARKLDFICIPAKFWILMANESSAPRRNVNSSRIGLACALALCFGGWEWGQEGRISFLKKMLL